MDKDPDGNESVYAGLAESTEYVGMDKCKVCHADQHATFIETGMGKSFDDATRQKSAARFDENTLVYDTVGNLYYRPYWNSDTLKVLEYRLSGNDTIHSRIETIDYIIGSGQHTNSHIMQLNGYYYQVPVTFYTQKGVWDMAPGFERGYNSRFGRTIGPECITCHNSYPVQDQKAPNKFFEMPNGITCERCHGPGGEHVAQMETGMLVDTSRFIDYSIVNPRKLPVDLQIDLCQRCHLQGMAILKKGKTWFDFKPGMKQNEVMEVFLPDYEGNHSFIMASQVERLKESACFSGGELSCITCHDPHQSVQTIPDSFFNDKCLNCHNPANQKTCTLSKIHRKNNPNNCISCHMEKSGSIDIPHVAVTDHKIKIPDQDSASVSNNQKWKGLKCLTNDNPAILDMAKGYIRYVEGYAGQTRFLDTALNLAIKAKPGDERMEVVLHILYLQGKYDEMLNRLENFGHIENTDANTNFRIGEAFANSGQIEKALHYFTKAVEAEPLNLVFLNRLGTAYMHNGQFDDAKEIFGNILKLQPKYTTAMLNFGTLLLNTGGSKKGVDLLFSVIFLDPDYTLAYYNLTAFFEKTKQIKQAKAILNRLLLNQPGNMKAREWLRKL
jgi:Flp pilus assembly protein TadD